MITSFQKCCNEGDSNPRCTHGRENVGQSNYVPEPTCASPAGVSSMGEVRVILTRLEPSVLPGTAVKKKSRILWNEEKEKRLMELYERSNADPSRGCARRLLEAWTLTYPEYSTTSNALMKRVRLIKSRPVTTQMPNSDSLATAEVEESSLPNPPVPRGPEAGGSGPNITTSAVGATRDPVGSSPQGEPEEEPVDSSPDLDELVKQVVHHYRKLLRETNLRGRRSTKWPGVRVDGRQRAAINQWMRGVKPKTPWEVNCMVYAAASILRPQKSPESVSQVQGQRKEKCLHFRRLIAWLDVEIACQKQNAKATPRQRWIRRQLHREFHTLALKRLLSNREETLGKLRIWKTQEKRKREKREFVEVDNLWAAQRKFLFDHSHLPQEVPVKAALEQFWAGILEVNGRVNEEDPDIKGWEEEMESSLGDLEPEEKLCLDEARFRKILKKAKSWSAPGPDGIVNFWWKVFPEAERALRLVTEEMLNAATPFPDWLVTGRTILIPKKGEAKDPGNYRPIACLNTQYKFATAVMADSLAAHVEANDLLPQEQRALRRGARGCVDCLAVDRMVITDARFKGLRALSVGWIDFEKAYDRVPHEWVTSVLDTVRAPRWVRSTVGRLQPMWRTVMGTRSAKGTVRTRPIVYKRGLFQGDALSPILFCLAILPLSHALRKLNGYRIRRSTVKGSITHMLYMDDLKLYAESPAALTEALSVVDRVSSAVGMKLGLRKCGVAHMQKGRVLPGPENPGTSPEDGIKCLSDKDTYRYLGIEQLFATDDKKVKDSVIAEYKKRLHKIWKSQLNSRHKVDATNTLAISLLRYRFVTVKWTRRELRDLDVLTWKVLRRYQSHHLNASPERLYLPRSQGGRGLMSCLLTWEREVVSLGAYLASIRDPIMVVVYKHLQLWAEKSSFSLLPSANKILQEAGCDAAFPENPPLGQKRIIRDLRKAQVAQLVSKAASKQHQGKFLSDMRCQAALNETLSVQWLIKGHLKSTTEALILAAQDDCIYTRSFKANCMGNAGDTHCRQCGEGVETVRHILSQCRPKGFNLYMERHDRALLAVYFDLCKHYGFEVGSRGWELETLPIRENQCAKILWDVPIPTDRNMVARRPDVFLQDKRTKRLYLIEMAVAWDSLQVERRAEKLSKYGELCADLRGQYPGYRLDIVPVVIGALGTVTHHLVGDLGRLPTAGKTVSQITGMQRSVLCSAARILRSHLSACELAA